jgi:hypothetical protein
MTNNTEFTYERWRHGGWYVTNLRYPNGALGCVSRNYPDKKWRISCDPRPFEKQPTFRSRDEAARAERDLIAKTITVWVVTTCIPDRGEKPRLPIVFATEAEAVAYLEEMLRNEWDSCGPYDDEGEHKRPYPGNWQDANDQIAADYDDGSWGEWQLSCHNITTA